MTDGDYVLERWKRMHWPQSWNHLLTHHLQDDVVREDLAMSLASVTHPDNPRQGIVHFGLTVHGEDNPPLSADEAEYVVAALLSVARTIWRRYGDERPLPEPPAP